VVHRRLQGGGQAAARRRCTRPAHPPAGRDLRRLRGAVRARGRRRFRRTAAAHLRAAARQRPAARALPAPLHARAGRRVPGHQPAAVRVAEDARAAAGGGRAGAAGGRCAEPVRGGRRRPEHLRLPWRARGQHGRLRARVPGRPRGQAGAELPLGRPHPRCRQRADRAQPAPARQEPAHRRRGWRAGARARGPERLCRGAVDARGARDAASRRDSAQPVRAAVPQQRAEPGARERAVQRRSAVPRLRWVALLRAGRGQACAGLPAPDREPRRRHQLPARGQLPGARHRRSHRGAAAGCRPDQRPQPGAERRRRAASGWSSRCASRRAG